MIQDGTLYTSSRLVETSVEDSDVFTLLIVSDTVVEPYNARLSVHQNSLLVWTSRENDDWMPYLSEFILLFQLFENSFKNKINHDVYLSYFDSFKIICNLNMC